MKQPNINVEAFMKAQFGYTKFWWTTASLCRFLIVVINAIALFITANAGILAFVAVILTIAQPLAQWYSDRLKSAANSILRKIEMAKGLDWAIKPREISDIVATLPKRVKQQAEKTAGLPENYFSSQEPPSPRRLLQNLEESAWWTKHQARPMAWYAAIFSCAVVGVAIIILIISLQSALSQATANNIAKVTISVIAFVFSGGYIRLADDYNRLAYAAEWAEDKAHSLKDKSDLTESEAIKVVHDYHIARAGSPLLPEWLWKMKQKELNELWDRRATQS